MGTHLPVDHDIPDALRQIRSSRNMAGRYYLEKWYRSEEHRSFLPNCETKLVTPEFVRFSTPFPALLDDRAFVYVEGLGLMRGIISRAMGPTSEMEIAISNNERAKLASRIMWSDIQAGFKGTDLRRFPRYRPADTRSALTLPDGRVLDCQLVDISPTGAAIESELRPPIDSAILLGRIHSEIRRHTDRGFAVEFNTVQDPAALEALLAPPELPAASDVLILSDEYASTAPR
jgi:hypothetical protein